MPGYGYITLAQLRTQFAERLDDTGNVYWVAAELNNYITEALRTWQSLSRYWRGRMQFPLKSKLVWYDLTQQVNTLIPYTVKDTDLNTSLAYALVETPPNGGSWLGTQMFTIDDFTKAVQRRRDQFLVETGMVLTVAYMNGISPSESILFLPDSVIDVRRGAWLDAPTNAYVALWPSDEFNSQAFMPAWATSPGLTPLSWSIVAQPPVQLQLIPPPVNGGNLEYVSVNAGAALNPSVGVLLGIPDDFTWVVKWGALADLLGREGESNDPTRAQYCEQRWQQGILAARAWTSALTCYVDGQQVVLSSLTDLDTFQPSWESQTPDTPTVASLGGWNLLGLSPTPDTNPHSVQMDVLQNAPIPASDSSFIQVGREELDVILDYAAHLASFKEGGNELASTSRLWQNMVRLAVLRNERLAATMKSVEAMFDRAQREERQRERREPALPVGVGPDSSQ